MNKEDQSDPDSHTKKNGKHVSFFMNAIFAHVRMLLGASASAPTLAALRLV